MINTYLIKKISLALVECFKTFRKAPPSQLIMTLLVKNEESMLEENLLFHKAMGVDSFIITDNNSTDSTPEIIRKYKQKGWIKEVIEEKATDYEQKEWVDRMIWKAKTIYKADWIINADADELWYSSLRQSQNRPVGHPCQRIELRNEKRLSGREPAFLAVG